MAESGALAMVFQINPQSLAQATRVVKTAPGWLKVLSSVPMPAWWVAAIVLGAALWWIGMLLRPRYGTPALFVAPLVMTRKVARVTEELCGTTFSKSTVSALCGRLDAELLAWRTRSLSDHTWPYLLVDARFREGAPGRARREPRGADRLRRARRRLPRDRRGGLRGHGE
jgi:hypothetical protein